MSGIINAVSAQIEQNDSPIRLHVLRLGLRRLLPTMAAELLD